MRALSHRIRRFWTGEEGPTTTEYAVMLALIIIASMLAIYTLGLDIRGLFQGLSDSIDAMRPA